MYYISNAVQHVGLQNGRSIEHCVLLNVGCLVKAIVASFIHRNYFRTNLSTCSIST